MTEKIEAQRQSKMNEQPAQPTPFVIVDPMVELTSAYTGDPILFHVDTISRVTNAVNRRGLPTAMSLVRTTDQKKEIQIFEPFTVIKERIRAARGLK